ncbi:MAG TPA: PKD domain-containing protein, partial [Saprospiraceae bacterium]|nr:PKD domain-containing protein [Saprospiraceae bacterium]
GDSINYGVVWNSFCSGYPGAQGIIMLPFPGNPSKAIAVHTRINDGYTGTQVQYTVIDFELEGGLGEVVIKDQFLDELPLGDYITATQHANGRDWWVLTPETGTNRFYIYLITPSGISNAVIQSVGEPWGSKYWSGQMTFSPDGTILARIDPNNGLYLYYFDRCSGVLSNQRHFDPFIEHSSGAGGVAFSSDSRFLYVTYLTKIFQLDLWESDLISSLVVVAEYDDFQAPFPATFYQAALAPDNKIYLTATNGVYVMHVIHHPERKGMDCKAEPHGLVLPVHNTWHVPNFPYYRLGPLDGSPCDTLGLNNVPVADFRWEIDTSDDKLVLFRNTSYFLPEVFSWTFGDASTSTEKDPIHGYAAPGIYEVCLTVSNVYGSDTKCREVDLLSSATSDPVLTDSGIRVYPNPASTTLHFACDEDFSGYVVLYDVFGNPIRRESIAHTQNHIMNTADLSGLYFYQLIDGHNKIVENGKIVIAQ